jgi:5'-nucleotidase
MEKQPSHNQEFLIQNKEAFDAKLQKLKEAGPENFHVLTDFDRTLTQGMINGEKTPSIISRLRSGNYLSEKYVEEAHRLYNHYQPIEVDQTIPLEKRVKEMDAWWQAHFDLLAKSGLTLDVLKEVVDQHPRMFREGALEFLDLMHAKDVPVIIMSASLGDMIRLYLEKTGRNYPNIYLVTNLFEFDEQGKVIGVKQPIVHSLNKYEVLIKGLPVYEKVKERKNVLLMGDGLGDLGMIDGFDYDELVSIGFYNQDYQVNDELKNYQDSFDAIITSDGDMHHITSLIDKIV